MNNFISSSKLFLKRNGSTILTGLAAVGVVSTAVMAVKATPKAIELLEKAKEEKGEELTKLEKVQVAGPSYIPSVVMGASTLICLFGANVLNKRHQAALVSAYTLVDSSYKEYKQKLKELYGEEAHEEIVNAITVEKAREVGINAECICANTCLTNDEACGEPVLFYEEWSHRYFETTIEQVITAQYHLNRNFVLRGYTTVNELYDFLGLDTTKEGDVLGWAVEDELYWIDFDNRKTVLDDGLEVYIIETPWGPTPDFLEYYY